MWAEPSLHFKKAYEISLAMETAGRDRPNVSTCFQCGGSHLLADCHTTNSVLTSQANYLQNYNSWEVKKKILKERMGMFMLYLHYTLVLSH